MAKFGYWNCRSYGQPVRLLLVYVQAEFEDKRYNYLGDNYDRSEWFKDKFNLGLDFPNIPYYVDDDVKLSQTMAILKYLGRKYDLIPIDEKEKIRVDLIEAEALDMRSRWTTMCYGEDIFGVTNMDLFYKSRSGYLENFKLKLKEISEFLGDHPYLAGNHITYIDFLMYELLDVNNHFEAGILNNFPNLKNYHDRIEQLPNLAAYMKSDKYLTLPFTTRTLRRLGRWQKIIQPKKKKKNLSIFQKY